MSIASTLYDIAQEEDVEVKRIAELGVYLGQTMRRMVNAFDPVHYVGVDYWAQYKAGGKIQRSTTPERWDQVYLILCEFAADKPVQLIRADTASAAECFPDGYFDLVFVDADHTEEGCGKDIDAWIAKVRPAGIMCGHDYKRRRSGVQDAVSKRFPEHKVTENTIWWTVKQ
jgi:hypothetical protein